jgi:hypothetical protein
LVDGEVVAPMMIQHTGTDIHNTNIINFTGAGVQSVVWNILENRVDVTVA